MYRDENSFCITEYAKAFVLPQTYQNLFSVEEAFPRGTIFKDLYMPYRENKHK